MTKTQMLAYIEITGMVIDFDYNYLMRRRNKAQIQELYEQAKAYAYRHYGTEIMQIMVYRNCCQCNNLLHTVMNIKQDKRVVCPHCGADLLFVWDEV